MENEETRKKSFQNIRQIEIKLFYLYLADDNSLGKAFKRYHTLKICAKHTSILSLRGPYCVVVVVSNNIRVLNSLHSGDEFNRRFIIRTPF